MSIASTGYSFALRVVGHPLPEPVPSVGSGGRSADSTDSYDCLFPMLFCIIGTTAAPIESILNSAHLLLALDTEICAKLPLSVG